MIEKWQSIYRTLTGGTISAAQAQNLRAFLAVIRRCEGTDHANGYTTWFGGKQFTSLKTHPGPRRDITYTHKGKTFHPSAAGAYQILIGTYNTLVNKGIISDFSPLSQDTAAVYLIKGRGALQTVLAGNLEGAYAKLKNEWASLPGASQYKSANNPRTALSSIFASHGGKRL